jgi:hypothetical protein
MKIHLSVDVVISDFYVAAARESWERDELIPFEEKACTGLMMGVEHREFLTKNRDNVTCKHCLKTK